MSDYALAVSCAIEILMPDTDNAAVCTTLDILSYELTQKFNMPRRFIEHLKQGLEELIEHSFVKVVEKRAGLFLLDCSGLIVDENEKYATVSRQEVQNIFQISNTNVFHLLKYFVCLMSTLSNTIDVWADSVQHKQGVVGMFGIQFLSELSQCPERTVVEYNKMLEENKLIYIYRAGDFVINKETGELKRLTNVYGRVEDKMYIDSFAQKRNKDQKSYKYVEKNITAVNEKRKLAQKYNQLLNGNDNKYSKEEIQKIYTYILSENAKYQKTYEKTENEFILDKIRDVKVFEKYDFLQKH